MGLLKRKFEENGYFDDEYTRANETYTRIAYDEYLYHKQLQEANGY